MAHRNWLERVADDLARRGVPADARARLLGELRDHLDDLTEGGADMATELMLDERMGKADVVAETAATEYGRAGWAWRYRLLVFGLTPVPATFVGLVLYVAAFMLIGWAASAVLYGSSDAIPKDVMARVLVVFAYSLAVVPCLALAALFGRAAVRYRAGRWWLAAAVVQVALIAGALVSRVTVSDVPGMSTWQVGMTFPWGWTQVLQLMLPLVIGGLFLRAARRPRLAAV